MLVKLIVQLAIAGLRKNRGALAVALGLLGGAAMGLAIGDKAFVVADWDYFSQLCTTGCRWRPSAASDETVPLTVVHSASQNGRRSPEARMAASYSY